MADFDFVTSGYTGSVSPADFELDGVDGVGQLTIATVGQTPSTPADASTTPNQLAISTVGGIAGVIVGPAPLSITTSGQVPGVIVSPTKLVITTTGETPTVEFGPIGPPVQASIATVGGIAGAIVRPAQLAIATVGATPSFVNSPGQLSISTLGATPSFVNSPGQLAIATVGATPSVVNRPGQLAIATVGRTPIPSVTPGTGVIAFTGQLPGFGVEIIPAADVSGHRLLCTLTGANDSLDDIVLPISSYTNLTDAELKVTATIVVPNGNAYATDIANRSNGALIFESITLLSNGTQTSSFSTPLPLLSVRSDQGARSFSVTITSGETIASTTRKTVGLNGVSYISTNIDNAIRVRATIDASFNIGDIATLDNADTFEVSTITHVMSGGIRYTELSSAAGII